MNRFFQVCANRDKNLKNPYIIGVDYGAILFCDDIWYEDITKYASPYIYKDYRYDKGLYQLICEKLNKAGFTILTFEDCGVSSYLKYKNIEYEEVKKTPEYSAIEKYYEGKYAKRTGLHYMNHIDEGCYFINDFYDNNFEIKQIYCLHPIFQNGDEEKVDLSECSINAKKLAKKYAELANSYLPKDYESDPPKTYTSTMVKSALSADKWQNYKDFNNNRGKFSLTKQEQLDTYFNKWFKILNVPKNYSLPNIEVI